MPERRDSRDEEGGRGGRGTFDGATESDRSPEVAGCGETPTRGCSDSFTVWGAVVGGRSGLASSDDEGIADVATACEATDPESEEWALV
jgi:hypothetical protein